MALIWSSEKFVNTPISKSQPATLCNFKLCEDTSIITTSQFSLAILLNNCCNLILSGVVLSLSSNFSSPIYVAIVPTNPTGEGGHGGGGVAAPVASQILTEVLPYLEVSKDNISSEDIKMNVDVPNVVGLTYKEAKKALRDVGLEITLRNEETEVSDDYVISKQVPNSGVQILEGGSVIVE